MADGRTKTKAVFISCIVVILIIYAVNMSRESNDEQARQLVEQTASQSATPRNYSLNLTMPAGWSDEERQKGLAAFKIFAENCPVLFAEYAGDITSLRISKVLLTPMGKSYDYKYEQYGWDSYYEMTIEINSNPHTIPAHCGLSGQTLWYAFGKGRSTGIELVKGLLPGSSCALNGDNMLIPVSAMESIEF